MIGLREDQQMKVRMVNFLNYTAAECGRGLPPIAVVQKQMCPMTRRNRGQAPSHSGRR
ncbi:hypothetical protein SAMN04490190_4527 [Pseudomonas libanensis]|nr:hypothetical protein SAMN04490190_4527 [Pseudomonas libanensis]